MNPTTGHETSQYRYDCESASFPRSFVDKRSTVKIDWSSAVVRERTNACAVGLSDLCHSRPNAVQKERPPTAAVSPNSDQVLLELIATPSSIE